MPEWAFRKVILSILDVKDLVPIRNIRARPNLILSRRHRMVTLDNPFEDELIHNKYEGFGIQFTAAKYISPPYLVLTNPDLLPGFVATKDVSDTMPENIVLQDSTDKDTLQTREYKYTSDLVPDGKLEACWWGMHDDFTKKEDYFFFRPDSTGFYHNGKTKQYFTYILKNDTLALNFTSIDSIVVYDFHLNLVGAIILTQTVGSDTHTTMYGYEGEQEPE